MSGVDRLVVGASGSPASLLALRQARDLARCHQVPIVVVLAWTPPGGEDADRRYPSPALRRCWERHFTGELSRAAELAWGGLPADLDVTLLLLRGRPGPALVEVADQRGDMLIVGIGRRSGIFGLRQAKVSRYCLAHARCPVLVVPQAATARQLGLRPGTWMHRHLRLTLDQVDREWRATA